MCVIVMQPAGKILSNTRFKRCWKRNSDGGGFAYPDGEGNMIVSKGYLDQKTMLKAYRSANHLNPTVPFLIHFRIATSGLTDEENTHPFQLGNDLAVAHNGHINGWGNKQISDTHQFVLKMLAHLPSGFHRDPITAELIRGYIGSDKMVMMDAEGHTTILNESLGIWDGKIWYSNTSFRKPTTYNHKTWKGHGVAKWYPKAEKKEEDEVQDATMFDFTGLDCCLCTMQLTEEDDDLCSDVAAIEPVCVDCAIHVGLKDLLRDGIIQYYDVAWERDHAAPYYEPEDMIPIEDLYPSDK